MPGRAYVSEQLAAALAVRAGQDFRCKYAGVVDLAKGYGACRL